MSAALQRVLRLLQAVAYARIQCDCLRLSQATPRQVACAHRLDRLTRELACLQGALTPDEQVTVRLQRALFLRLLLASAPQRLDAWSDTDALDRMPTSHLLEWVAHDFERMELAEVEAAMSPQERVRYAGACAQPDPQSSS